MATLNRTNSIYLSGVITNLGQPQCTQAGTFYQQFALYREVESEKGIRTETIPLGVIGEELVTVLSFLQDNQPILVKGKLDIKVDKSTGKSTTKITVVKLIPTASLVKENHGYIVGNVSGFYDPEINGRSESPVLSNAGKFTKTVFSIAHNEQKYNEASGQWEDLAKFFSFECWNGVSKVLASNEKGLTKGSQVAIQFSVKYDTYKEQGRLVLLVDDIQFSRKNNGHTKPTVNEDADLSDVPF